MMSKVGEWLKILQLLQLIRRSGGRSLAKNGLVHRRENVSTNSLAAHIFSINDNLLDVETWPCWMMV